MHMKTQLDRTPILESLDLPKPGRCPRATQAEAKTMDKEAIRLIGEMKSSWLRLGSLIQRMIDTQAFQALGFPSMQAWMNARLGESASSVFSALRSLRALEGVPRAKLERIGERNAHVLTYLPEKERKSDEWIEKAAKLPTKEFKREAETFLEVKTGIPRDKFKTLS